MGEIADELINGDFDFYTGEYLGRGYGIPRTKNKSLEWEKGGKRHDKSDYTKHSEAAYNGIKVYIIKKWNGRPNTPSTRSIVSEYLKETNIDLKQKCMEIQKDFGSFVKFINQKLKETK